MTERNINSAFYIGWLPTIIWLLAYEGWALWRSYGYTLSEAVWWCVYDATRLFKRKAPPQVRTSMITGWGVGISWLCVISLKYPVWGFMRWVYHGAPEWIFGLVNAVLFSLVAHFFWQRKSTYDLIASDEWRQWYEIMNGRGKLK